MPEGRYRGLIPFKPGAEWKGNRNGRPKKVSLTDLIQKRLAETELAGQPTPDERTVAEWLVDHMIKHAMKGNASYMEEIIDRNDGPIPKPDPTPPVSMEIVAEMEAASERLDRTDPPPPPDALGPVPGRPEPVQ